MTITPLGQISKLLDFRVVLLTVILERQSCRIKDTNIAAKPEQNARAFEEEKP